MKKISPLLLLLVLFSACKKEDVAPKEDDKQNSSVNLFAANEALIDSTSALYFICDVEGLTGISQINKQRKFVSGSYSWGGTYCPSAHSSYIGIFYISYVEQSQFSFDLAGFDLTRESAIVSRKLNYCTDNSSTGISFSYQHEGEFYKSALSDNAALTWANAEIISNKSTGKPDPGPYYFVKVRFNCELTSVNDPTKKIKLKNAVAQVAL